MRNSKGFCLLFCVSSGNTEKLGLQNYHKQEDDKMTIRKRTTRGPAARGRQEDQQQEDNKRISRKRRTRGPAASDAANAVLDFQASPGAQAEVGPVRPADDRDVARSVPDRA